MATEVIATVIPGGGGDYSLLSGFESGEQNDHVTADEISVAECYSGEITDNVAFAGSTTDATRYIEVRPAVGYEHGGDRTAGFRITGTATGLIRPADSYVRIRGIVILPTSNNIGILGQAGLVDLLVDSCVIYGGGTSTGIGISPGTQANAVVRASNNFIYGFKGASVGYGIRDGTGAGGVTHAYNNTIVDCRFCIARLSTTMRPKNNITQDPGSGCFTGTMTDAEGNISSDTTSPNVALRGIDLDFVDAANGDYHLAAGDTEAIGAGTDLHADANLAFNYDIDGDTRPDGEWDIGADQIAAAGGATLEAGQGSYTLTGNAAGLFVGYRLNAEAGSYSLAGQSVGLSAARILVATSGSYDLTGVSAALLAGRRLSGAVGSYTLTGQAAAFLVDRVLAADTGVYVLTGYPAGLIKSASSYILLAEAGSYAATGPDVALLVGRQLAAGAGAYTLTGQPATFLRGLVLPASPGVYTLTGRSAGLLAGRALAAGAGSYALTGQAALFTYARVLLAARGQYALTGRSAELIYEGLGKPLSKFTDLLPKIYVPSAAPPVDPVVLAEEFRRLQEVLDRYTIIAPQVTDRDPSVHLRGMMRCAVFPWDPLSLGTWPYWVWWNGSAWVAV